MSSTFLLISKKKCDIINCIEFFGGEIMSKVSILGVNFNIVNRKEASEIIFTTCKNKNEYPLTVVTPNPIMVMTARGKIVDTAKWLVKKISAERKLLINIFA